MVGAITHFFVILFDDPYHLVVLRYVKFELQIVYMIIRFYY